MSRLTPIEFQKNPMWERKTWFTEVQLDVVSGLVSGCLVLGPLLLNWSAGSY